MYRLEKEQQLADLEKRRRETNDAEKRESERKQWMEEQQQKIIEARLQKQLALERPSGNTDSLSGRPYEPEAGFSVFFDYVLGLSQKVARAGMVFCFYEEGVAKTVVQSLPHLETDPDMTSASGAIQRRCVISEQKPYKRVPALAGLYLLLEVQCVVGLPQEGKPAKVQLGWCIAAVDGGCRCKLLDGLFCQCSQLMVRYTQDCGKCLVSDHL